MKEEKPNMNRSRREMEDNVRLEFDAVAEKHKAALEDIKKRLAVIG